MSRHWSFVVTDRRYLHIGAALILLAGLTLAVTSGDATHFSRVGNFVIGTGVWMSMRYTLREGINRVKDSRAQSPVLPGPGPARALNSAHFNNIAFSIGDAILQVHGFALVLVGSAVGSYGDWALQAMLPTIFK